MPFELSERSRAEIESLIARYPTKKSCLLLALRVVERQQGWVSLDGMALVAAMLGLSPAEVYGVVTFYPHYKREVHGKYRLMVCGTLTCALLGMKRLVRHIEERLGVACGGARTADGLFSLEKVECIAACGGAPAIQINDQYHENVTPQKLDDLIAACRREHAAGGGPPMPPGPVRDEPARVAHFLPALGLGRVAPVGV
ncbi:MAG: NAD(P)H-dependent oxidoreductase subunit E [Planctomycetes bacterium]|nr:NAD(P)H-dependent oxidoreductase subunit E [Planctomycetota bacterium]